MTSMSKYLQRFLAWFRSEATTIGLSPKALAPAIGAALVALLNVAGLTPHDIGNVFGVSDEVAAAAVATVAATIAARLLAPGNVVRAEPDLTKGNDARLSAEAKELLAR